MERSPIQCIGAAIHLDGMSMQNTVLLFQFLALPGKQKGLPFNYCLHRSTCCLLRLGYGLLWTSKSLCRSAEGFCYLSKRVHFSKQASIIRIECVIIQVIAITIQVAAPTIQFQPHLDRLFETECWLFHKTSQVMATTNRGIATDDQEMATANRLKGVSRPVNG